MSSHLQLSAEQFRHIRHHLKWDKQASDKRTSPRVGVRNSVPMSLMGPKGQMGRRHSVPVRNISRNGIGFLHEDRLPMGCRFAITLPIDGEKELVAIYEVKHCETLEQRLFGIGGRLLAMGDPEEKPAPPAKTAAPPAPAEAPSGNVPPRQKTGLAATG